MLLVKSYGLTVSKTFLTGFRNTLFISFFNNTFFIYLTEFQEPRVEVNPFFYNPSK